MQTRPRDTRRTLGFTMIELMIVVAIIGVLSSIAIPLLGRHQLRTKTTEAKTNLSAIRVVEEAQFSETGLYVAANAEPAVIPGTNAADFDVAGSDYAAIGWAPEGRVFFSYAVTIAADASGYTADAGADLDGDGVVQIWGYTKPDASGAVVNGGIGCNATLLTPEVLGSCTLNPSVF